MIFIILLLIILTITFVLSIIKLIKSNTPNNIPIIVKPIPGYFPVPVGPSPSSICDINDKDKLNCGSGENWKEEICNKYEGCCFEQKKQVPYCFYKKNWLGDTCKSKFKILPEKFPDDKTSCSTIRIISPPKISSTLQNFFNYNIPNNQPIYNLYQGALMISDSVYNIKLDTSYINKYFNLYCNNRGLSSKDCKIKVFFIQASLSAFPEININKLEQIINNYFKNEPSIKKQLLDDLDYIVKQLYNKSQIEGVDLGVVHSGLGFFNECDIPDNKFDITKMICTLELWGAYKPTKTNLFLYQLLPYLNENNSIDYSYIPNNTINMVAPHLFGCDLKNFYTNSNGDIHFQNSIYIGETSLDNICDMFEYSKQFNDKYPYYTTITVNDNPGINCDYFAIEMINYLKSHDTNFTNNNIIQKIKCPIITLSTNDFTDISNNIQNNSKNIKNYTKIMNNLFSNLSPDYLLGKTQNNILDGVNIGKISFLLKYMAPFIIKFINLYIEFKMPFNNYYYVLYSNINSDKKMKLSKLRNVNLSYFYDNTLVQSIINKP